jgi:hypothetical protein
MFFVSHRLTFGGLHFIGHCGKSFGTKRSAHTMVCKPADETALYLTLMSALVKQWRLITLLLSEMMCHHLRWMTLWMGG